MSIVSLGPWVATNRVPAHQDAGMSQVHCGYRDASAQTAGGAHDGTHLVRDQMDASVLAQKSVSPTPCTSWHVPPQWVCWVTVSGPLAMASHCLLNVVPVSVVRSGPHRLRKLIDGSANPQQFTSLTGRV